MRPFGGRWYSTVMDRSHPDEFQETAAGEGEASSGSGRRNSRDVTDTLAGIEQSCKLPKKRRTRKLAKSRKGAKTEAWTKRLIADMHRDDAETHADADPTVIRQLVNRNLI